MSDGVEHDVAVAAAEAEVSDLETRVLDGDESVTAEDVDGAHRRLRFLRLRRHGAETRSGREAAAARLEVAAEVADDIRAMVGRSPLRPGSPQAAKAVIAINKALGEYQGSLQVWGEEAGRVASRAEEVLAGDQTFAALEIQSGSVRAWPSVVGAEGDYPAGVDRLHERDIDNAVRCVLDAALSAAGSRVRSAI